MKKSFNVPKAKRKLDKLFSSFILNRDKRICQWCGKVGDKQDTAHIIPRSYLILRWNPENALCLCFKCHQLRFHQNPIETYQWLEKKFGIEKLDSLLRISKMPFIFGKYEYDCILKDLSNKSGV